MPEAYACPAEASGLMTARPLTDYEAVTRLTAENAALRSLLETAYRRVDLGVACDYVGFLPANWHDFHATPDAAFSKWSQAEIDALLHVVKY